MVTGYYQDIGIQCGQFRKGFINRIAAWAIENRKKKVVIEEVFPEYLRRIKNAYFEEHRLKVARIARFALEILTDADAAKLDAEQAAAGKGLIDALVSKHGYCEECARAGLAKLFFKRYDKRQ